MKDYVADTAEGTDFAGTGSTNARPQSAVAQTVREAILGGATNKMALALAAERHPGATMNARYVATIRSGMRAAHAGLQTSHGVRASEGSSAKHLIMAAIRAGKSNAEVAEEVRRAVPGSAVKEGVVSFYRGQMRRAGEEVPTNWDVRPAREKPPVRPTAKKDTVGNVAEEAIRGGATDGEALEAVRAAFPGARTTPDGIAFYRSRLRKAGEPVPTSSEVKRSRAAEPTPL
jgi:hypothetical protein